MKKLRIDEEMEPIDEEMERLFNENLGKGVSPLLSDNAFWLEDYDSPFIEAFVAVDHRGDKTPLLTLLRSAFPMLALDWLFLADLFDRYGQKLSKQDRLAAADLMKTMPLAKKRGRPRVPAYDLSKVELNLHLISRRVRYLQREGYSFDDAVASVAKESKLNETTLINFCNSRRGISQRMKKRRT
jgi:hypothetical protein